jgi:hypothetical protein
MEHCEPKENMSENRYIGAICFDLKGTERARQGLDAQRAHQKLNDA